MQIPGGALSEPTTFVYQQAPSPSTAPSGLQPAGLTFVLEAYQNGQYQAGFVFQQPVTLTITYTEAQIDGLDEDKLELYYYDSSTQTWKNNGIQIVERDTENNRLVATISHLTPFGMFGKVTGYKVYLPGVLR